MFQLTNAFIREYQYHIIITFHNYFYFIIKNAVTLQQVQDTSWHCTEKKHTNMNLLFHGCSLKSNEELYNLNKFYKVVKMFKPHKFFKGSNSTFDAKCTLFIKNLVLHVLPYSFQNHFNFFFSSWRWIRNGTCNDIVVY